MASASQGPVNQGPPSSESGGTVGGLSVDGLRLLTESIRNEQDRRITLAIEAEQQRVDLLFKERDDRYTQLAAERASKGELLAVERDKQYEQRFEAQKEAITKAEAATKEAINKAEAATEKRFAGVNEFRQTLSDQATLFMPRSEAAAASQNIQDRLLALEASVQASLNDLKDRVTRMESERAGNADSVRRGQAMLASVIGAVGFFITMVVLLSNGVFGG